MTSYAYLSLSSCSLTRRVPALIPPCIPLRTFHHPARFKILNKPIHTAPRSTLTSSSVLSKSLNDAKDLAFGRYNKSHTHMSTLSSSHAGHPTKGVPAQPQSHLCSGLPSSNNLNLALKVYTRALQREGGLSGWRWTLHSPQPSGDTIIIKSSLLGLLGNILGLFLFVAVVIAALCLMMQLMLNVLVFALPLIAPMCGKKKGVCSRCGKSPVFPREYWCAESVEGAPMLEWKLLCTECWINLREEGHED